VAGSRQIKKAAGRWQAVAALAIVSLGIGLIGGAGIAAASSPARFVYEVCDSALPGGNVPESSAYGSSVFVPTENCAAPGGWIGLVQVAPAAATFSAMGIAVPETPGGFVEAETITGVGYLPGATSKSHVNENDFPGPAGVAQRIFHIHSERTPFWSNGGAVTVAMSCDGNVPGGCPGAGPFVGARYIAATEVDLSAPRLKGIGGTLLAGGLIRGHQSLAAEAHDEGGGLSNLSVLANGLPAAGPLVGNCNLYNVSNTSVYGMVAAAPTPCPRDLKQTWTIDTQAYPFHDGANSIQVCASDYANLSNPNTTCSAPASVNVDNSCVESPVPGGETLSAQFTRSEADTITVGYGKGAEVSGELHNNAGDAISGATICVKSQTLGLQSKLQPVGAVKTDAEGRFAYEVPAGPNREILIGYRHDSLQVAREVRFYAHARPSLHASPTKLTNGSRVRLFGRVPGPSAARRVVVLQANVAGSKRWITFQRATSGTHGDFQTGYRFNSTTRTTKYRFRAIMPRQDDYPWVEGHSKSVEVLVHG
jgi:hypothetical protein